MHRGEQVKARIRPHERARSLALRLLCILLEGEHVMAADELLTTIQAAEYLGIRPSTLRHWICDGKIDFVKYGNGLVRLKRSVLDRFVSGCTIKAKAHHGRTKESRLLEGAGLESREESLAR
jgi:excisionase family DNA binding protein